MELQERLRNTRVDRDESQADAAAAIGINQRQYSRYETGANEMPLRYLSAFCKHYQVSADYLLGLPKGLNWPR